MANISQVYGKVTVTGTKEQVELFYYFMSKYPVLWEYNTDIDEKLSEHKEGKFTHSTYSFSGSGRWLYINNISNLLKWIRQFIQDISDPNEKEEEMNRLTKMIEGENSENKLLLLFEFTEEEKGAMILQKQTIQALAFILKGEIYTDKIVLYEKTFPYTAQNLIELDFYDNTGVFGLEFESVFNAVTRIKEYPKEYLSLEVSDFANAIKKNHSINVQPKQIEQLFNLSDAKELAISLLDTMKKSKEKKGDDKLYLAYELGEFTTYNKYFTESLVELLKTEAKEKMMTLKDFQGLLQYIDRNHSFKRGGKGKRIKYVEPTIDMRIGKIFALRFRGFHDHEIAVVNENRDKNLKEMTYDWLNS